MSLKILFSEQIAGLQNALLDTFSAMANKCGEQQATITLQHNTRMPIENVKTDHQCTVVCSKQNTDLQIPTARE